VKVDGTPATGWVYDAPSNTVVFSSAPAPGAIVEISYTRAC
jgi:hypothetical protein